MCDVLLLQGVWCKCVMYCCYRVFVCKCVMYCCYRVFVCKCVMYCCYRVFVSKCEMYRCYRVFVFKCVMNCCQRVFGNVRCIATTGCFLSICDLLLLLGVCKLRCIA